MPTFHPDDDAFYVDYDKDTEAWRVKGNNSGFVYSSWVFKVSATKAAVIKNEDYQKIQRSQK